MGGKTTAVVCVVAISCIAAGYFVSVQARETRRKRRNLLEALYEKPQLRFKKVLADNSSAPFVHLGNQEKLHPYLESIRSLVDNPPPRLSQSKLSKDPPGLDGPCEWIDTRSQLESLASILNEEHEFAVDTEQHSVHSFLGFTALIQISTDEKDYLVDALALHDEMDVLRPAFANSKICKVFHGADSDNLWLQRDFHIYVVNMFDTARACDVLGKPQRSLAYLLREYCGVTTNKALQRADWRQRPLSAEMLHYARSDAHFLLYIARQLQDELCQGTSSNQDVPVGEESPFLQVLLRSNTLCLQLYDKEGACSSPSTAALSLWSRYTNSSPVMTMEESNLIRKRVKALCKWRDKLARLEDESLHAVLSNSGILALAKQCPTSGDAIFSVIQTADKTEDSGPILLCPDTSPSLVVRKHVGALSDLMKGTRGRLTQARLEKGSFRWWITSMLQSRWTESEGKGSFLWWITSMLQSRRTESEHDNARTLEQTQAARPADFKSKRVGRLADGKKVKRPWQKNQHWEKSRALFVKKFSCKGPVYENCRIFAGDGRLLCYCERKKLEWYVSKGLAEFLGEDPPTIRLLFEPKGRPEDRNNEFYIQSKKNRCVGCGEHRHYVRYRVVPSCYRQHFPEYLKSHRSHDIVLLCVDCHEVAHRTAELHKREVAEEFGVPLFLGRKTVPANQCANGETSAVVQNTTGRVSPMHLRNAAIALLRYGNTLPKKRLEELQEVVRTYYGGRHFSDEEFQAALLACVSPREQRRFTKQKGSKMVTSCSEAMTPNACTHDVDRPEGPRSHGSSRSETQNEALLGHGPHGRKVVEILLSQGGDDAIREFNQRWRQVFVEGLEPAFLPFAWDIHHSGLREFGDYSVYKMRGQDGEGK